MRLSCKVDWSLPMSPAGQLVFFKRVKALFARATVGIPLASKKKYRLAADELAKERNVAVFYSQVWAHLKSRIPEEEWPKWQVGFVEGKCLDDFLPFLDTRPSKISLSMLRSQKLVAERLAREKESVIYSEVSSQRKAVLDAQFKYLEHALAADQAKLAKVSQVPGRVKAKLHEKMVAMRQKQAEAGRQACQGYQDVRAGFATCV